LCTRQRETWRRFETNLSPSHAKCLAGTSHSELDSTWADMHAPWCPSRNRKSARAVEGQDDLGIIHNSVNMSGPKKYTRQEFLDVFPSLVEDIKHDAAKYKLPQNAMDWLEKVRTLRSHDDEHSS
jgi:hypothetical protein